MRKKMQITRTEERIVAALHGNLRAQRPILLYNIFHGVPITYEAQVVLVNPEYVGLSVHPYQAVCIKRERQTYLELPAIDGLIRGTPTSIDFKNQVVMLSQLKLAGQITKDLRHSWITPQKHINVELSSDSGIAQVGQLLMLAVLEENTLRVVVSVPPDPIYQHLDEMELAFKLPGQVGLIQVNGVVHTLTKRRNHEEMRLEVAGSAMLQDEIAIRAYIAQHEDTQLTALEKEYRSLRKKKG